MDRLRAALTWSGTDVTLSMFVVSPHPTVPPLEPGSDYQPDQLRTYELEDERGLLAGRHVYEYDLGWKDWPADLDQVVTDSLVSALREGAVVAWFGFEGSFDFEHVLHPDIASQVYAVAAGEAVRLALDDEYRLSTEWERLLAELRDRVVR